MQDLPFKQNPRPGQTKVIKTALQDGRSRLCAQLPTGYGKTFTATAVYSTLQRKGVVDRLLYIVPSTGQLNQFVQDGKNDLSAAGVEGNLYVCDIAFTGAAQSMKQHRTGSHQVFACTVQGLSSAGVGSTVKRLMESGRWMICVDEYHHYGVEKTWGRIVLDLERLPQCHFLLALSATPYRPDDDSAFGKPEVVVTYSQAVKENAVKPLRCHAYTYRIDAIDGGDVVSYTTQDLADRAGSDNPEALERVFREMRWSPKYISPLVDAPITRMLRFRLSTGYKLQALIGAFCCSHAQLVCDQVKAMFPELSVDWVGTGTNGRTDSENRAVLEAFCPPKKDGKRRQEDIKLDVLVHVGMAGEGLDTVYVSEVIHLNPANKNNSNDQENGRAARYLSGVTGFINVESGSDYARDYLGARIEYGFDVTPDEVPDAEEDEELDREREANTPFLPDEPSIQIVNCECIEINTGEVARMAEALHIASAKTISIDDPVLQEKAIELYQSMRRKEAEQFNERSYVEQWNDAVNNALAVVARRVIQASNSPEIRIDRSQAGDIKKRINTRKKRALGAVCRDVDVLRRHFQWLKELELTLIQDGIPEWLL